MTKQRKAIIIGLIGVVAIAAVAAFAGPVIYRDFFAAQPAPEPVLLSANDSELRPGGSEAVDPEGLSGAWVVGEGSTAGYRVDEVLNGTPVTVTGSTGEVRGSLTVSELTLESAEFEVDVASIATDRAQRDSYFRDQALNTSAHPTATFVLTEPFTAESAPAEGEVIEQSLSGELTIAGVTQAVTFNAQFRVNASNVEIAGQIPIVFEAFGITAPNLGFVSVAPDGFVEFSLVVNRG